MTAPLLSQVAVESISTGPQRTTLSQTAVEVLWTEPNPALLSQVVIEVLWKEPPPDLLIFIDVGGEAADDEKGYRVGPLKNNWRAFTVGGKAGLGILATEDGVPIIAEGIKE